MSTGTPISFNGRLTRLPDPKRAAGYRLVFPSQEVTIDAPAPTVVGTGAVVFPLRTDSPAPALPEGWTRRPFPSVRPTYWFPAFEKLLFVGTAPGVVTDPEPWSELAQEAGEGTLVFSAFLPPIALRGLVRLLQARRGNAAQVL